jgi:hypothetical protein
VSANITQTAGHGSMILESRRAKILTLSFLTVFTFLLLLLPRGFGGWFAYEVSRIYAGDHLTTDPDASLLGYLSLTKSIVLLSSLNDFAVFNSIAVLGISLSALCYFLLARRIVGRTTTSVAIAVIVPISLLQGLLSGYVISFALPLLLLMLFCTLEANLRSAIRYEMICLVFFVSLSFIWHSAFGAAFSILAAFYLLLRIGKLGSSRLYPAKLVYPVYFVVHWIFVQKTTLLNSLAGALRMDFIPTFVEALRRKGNLALQYSYSLTGFDLIASRAFTWILYGVYLATILYSMKISYEFLRNRKYRVSVGDATYSITLVVTTLLFGSALFVLIYFIAAKIVAPFILLAFLIPIGYLAFSTRARNDKVRITIICFALVLVGFALLNTVVLTRTSPEWHIPSENEEMREASYWIAGTAPSGRTTDVYSDSFTFGNMIWEKARFPAPTRLGFGDVHFTSVNYTSYVDILEGRLYYGSLYVDNQRLFAENLRYDSMTAWSSFAPINTELIDDRYNIVFSSGNLQVANKG